MLVPVHNMEGEVVSERELPDAVFGVEPNEDLMHQALVRQLANARLGTHSTKTRAEVRGGGRKPWKQKGLGRARHGSTRSPIWRHGGVTFGPKPRSYGQDLNKKMRRAAVRSALSVKARDGRITLVEGLSPESPRTRELAQAFGRLNLGDNVLVAVDRADRNLELASRNLEGVKVIRAGYLNIRDLLKHERLLMTVEALEAVEVWLDPDRSRAVEAQA
ncbi:MAG: 50S ribosomal protein L4 [Anaerolineae bacterium]|nr:50S ribosomal protein L4 [Anaerolineae bacterium]